MFGLTDAHHSKHVSVTSMCLLVEEVWKTQQR